MAVTAARVAWLMEGDRPSRGLPAIVHPPRATTSVTALQDGTGCLLMDVTQLPQMLGKYWGDALHSSRHSVTEAQAAFIVALHGKQLTSPTSDASEVSIAEVEAVLEDVTPGESPGLHVIPVELCKTCQKDLAPALVDVFTATGSLGRVPSGFLEEVMAVLYKNRGSPAMPGSHRLITLLCTDYRVLGKPIGPSHVPGSRARIVLIYSHPI